MVEISKSCIIETFKCAEAIVNIKDRIFHSYKVKDAMGHIEDAHAAIKRLEEVCDINCAWYHEYVIRAGKLVRIGQFGIAKEQLDKLPYTACMEKGG